MRNSGFATEAELRTAVARHSDGKPEANALISTMGILTCNRPEALKRCIASFLENFRQNGRRPRIVVTDDSHQSSMQMANVECLKELNASYPEFEFLYAGFAEKRRYSEALAEQSGVNPAIIEFALFNPEGLGQTSGANRNALFFETVGERFLSVDDDVVCRLSAHADAQNKIEITSRNDPTSVTLFPDHETLLRSASAMQADALALHEGILGKSLAGIIEARPEKPIAFRHLNAAFFHRLERWPAKVRISWTGIYGDSGSRYPTYYLWKDKFIQGQITASEEAYKSLSTSRQIFRAPQYLTLGGGNYCQSTALAYDHQSILPPFMPVLRGEDLLFGKILKACFGPSLIGYLPWAALHAPLEKRTNRPEDIALAGNATSCGQILGALISMFGQESGHNKAESLRRLGTHLCAMAQLSHADFSEAVYPQLQKLITNRRDYLEKQLADFPDAPLCWSSDIQAHREVLNMKLTYAGMKQSILLLEWDATPEERLMLAQRLALRFGQLLQAWHLLIQAAGDLKRQGITLASGTALI